MPPRDAVQFYQRSIATTATGSPQVRIVETDIDLYYHIAVEMHRDIALNNRQRLPSVYICPVGPTFQYRRFAWLCRRIPLDLSRVHLFFMDEYLTHEGQLLDATDSLSFRGFVERELTAQLDPESGFSAERIWFPDPDDPASYDRHLEELGGAGICFAGVGINGHLAFNEPPAAPDADSRVIALSRETIAINSNTALGGAWDQIPARAVTVGMRQILASRRLLIYLNRPWQRAVVRKMLYGPVTDSFPASYVQQHPRAEVTLTASVAEPPDFGLR